MFVLSLIALLGVVSRGSVTATEVQEQVQVQEEEARYDPSTCRGTSLHPKRYSHSLAHSLTHSLTHSLCLFLTRTRQLALMSTPSFTRHSTWPSDHGDSSRSKYTLGAGLPADVTSENLKRIDNLEVGNAQWYVVQFVRKLKIYNQ